MTVIPFLVAALLLAPAVRLLLLALRTRQMPELWAGLYFLGAGIGIPLRVYGIAVFTIDPESGEWINMAGHLFFAGGAIAMTLFTWRVFHPGRAVARHFALTTIAAIVATTVWTLVSGQGSQEDSIAIIATNFARLVPTGWAFRESFRYWVAMQKRVRLGLADPVVANRFGLWSIWTCAVSVLPGIALAARMLNRVFVFWEAGGTPGALETQIFMALQVVFLAAAPVAAVALSLSFFPPARYLDRIRERAAVAGEAA